ncbi:carotenoid biosynthesis protein [Deinococcus yavapaiensis]|uniref:Putative membrane protein n=1 Tax=Deinococcus yavapaiensis KR-236 TaxID=694435 RepID=A0A318S979_9DEIO|nr:carotenoid biosynthesis protein [Deinococcus yavapaiensis]PYE53581.1 putative membrane protein [Deinococcus yavapaiensis KR-236]
MNAAARTRVLGAAAWLGVAFAGALLLRLGEAAVLGGMLASGGALLSVLWAFGGDLLGRAEWTSEASSRLAWLRRNVEPWMVLVAVSALLRVPVPLWPEGFALIATAQTVLLALAALSWAWKRVGRRALLLFAACFVLGLAVEIAGSRAGFLFGSYDYDPPGPKVLGVPLLVPLGWWWMTLAALALSNGKPVLAGALMVALDVGLEPLMTTYGFWSWAPGGTSYYGVPWTNFLGWFVVGALLSWLILRLTPIVLTRGTTFRVAYLVELFFLPAGLLLLGKFGAALLTLVLMGGGAWISSKAAFAR